MRHPLRATLLLTGLLLGASAAIADEAPETPSDTRSSPAPGVPEVPEPTPEQERADEPSDRDEGGTPGKPLSYSQTPEAIRTFLRHYLRMYDRHLQSPDWIARSMAVIGLAMIDDPRSARKLIGVMEDDRAPIVRLYAWEALHARQGRLIPRHRALWKRRGMEFAEKNILRGEMRLGLVGLLAEGGPTPENKRWIKRVFQNTNSINPSDIRTLWALGDTIERWQCGELVRWLIERMKTLDDAYRAELVLRRLTDEIPSHGKLRMESSNTMWRTTYQRWMRWFKDQTFEERKSSECGPYTGGGEIMPPGEKITDTADRKWRQDLEMRRFHLDQLDVGLALDTTGSMRRPLNWIKRDVVKMMRAFELISREPRIGVTLYRDKGDKYVTRNIPLTAQAAELQKRLAPERPKGGGDIPEAVLEALTAMVQHQQWSPSPRASRVVVVMSDAPPKEDSLEEIRKLVTGTKERGFSFHCIKVRTSKYVERKLDLPNYDRELTTLDRIAQWGGGTSEWAAFWTQSQKNPRWLDTARPTEGTHADRVILRQVLRAALNVSYRKRVDAFIGVLLEYVEDPLPEKREPFPEATPGPAHLPTDPQMNR